MIKQKSFLLMAISTILFSTFIYGDLLKEGVNEALEEPASNLPGEIRGGDGALMTLIPSGEFQMGSNDGSGDEKPVHTVYTDAFYMDKYEVTNAQYAKFLNEYGKILNRELFFETDKYCPIEKFGDTYIPKKGFEYYPVTCVTWDGARAYAQYYGKRLPTEAEWEKAARGGLSGKKYPWGDTEPDGTQCNFADSNTGSGWRGEWADRNANDGYMYVSPVGIYAPNGYGLYDMAGNVWEWCSDWYGYYSSSYENNPKGADSGTRRVLRGGSWNNTPKHLRVSYRYSREPKMAVDYIGFRCAKDVNP